MAKPSVADVVMVGCFTFTLLRPATPAAREWFATNVHGPRLRGAVPVEPRYLPPILEGLQTAGLTVIVKRT